jgi:thiosulfate dehydrogenase (quinone) large subunit
MSPPHHRQLPVLTTRRAFVAGAVRVLAAGAVGGATTPLLASCGRDTTSGSAGTVHTSARHTETVDVNSLVADGQSLVSASAGPDGAPIIVLRQSADRYIALSMQCTHEGCPINPPVHGIMTCPCHGSQFDLAGHVQRGPAQFPLGHYDVAYHSRTRTLTISLD